MRLGSRFEGLKASFSSRGSMFSFSQFMAWGLASGCDLGPGLVLWENGSGGASQAECWGARVAYEKWTARTKPVTSRILGIIINYKHPKHP